MIGLYERAAIIDTDLVLLLKFNADLLLRWQNYIMKITEYL